MTTYVDTYQKISLSVAGIGYGNPPEFRIVGSGFLIHPSGIIATNWHVAKALLTEKSGQILIRSDACAVFFVHDPDNPKDECIRGMLAVPVTGIGGLPEQKTISVEVPMFRGLKPSEVIKQERPDISLLKVDFSRVPIELCHVPPVDKVIPRVLRVGEEVAICGFPQGLNFPVRYKAGDKIQLTPLLQVGHVAGVLPFDGVPFPSEYVLDIPVNGGSSGSPLFTSDGIIVGIVYAARMDFATLIDPDMPKDLDESSRAGVFVPTSLGLAVPATRFPKEMLKEK